MSEDIVKTFEIGHFGIMVELDGEGGGRINTPLIEDRPDNWEEDPYHVAVDTVLGLTLFHALHGVDVTADNYAKGIEAQLVALSEQYGEDE